METTRRGFVAGLLGLCGLGASPRKRPRPRRPPAAASVLVGFDPAARPDETTFLRVLLQQNGTFFVLPAGARVAPAGDA